MKKVLVVEDDKSIQLIIKVGLEDIGKLDVNMADNGVVGIELARTWKPDIILMDVMMPEMTGPEAIEILKQDENLKNIPVVFMTAASEEDKKDYYMEIGACDVVYKPFNPTGISTKLQQIYEREIK